jgi:hypothetical protein
VAFGVLALVSGGLQLWAYATADGVRHLVLGVFAAAVGGCVIVALVVEVVRRRSE